MARYIQVETAAENVLTYNRIFRAAIGDWSNTRTTVTDNAIIAPDGTVTADKIVENTDNDTHIIGQSFTPDGASRYCFSGYGRADERTWVSLRLSTAGFPNDTQVYFDLVNGIVGTQIGSPDSVGIEYVKDGYYRFWFTVTSNAAVSTSARIDLADADNSNSYLGDGSSGLYLWNAQVEIGSFPSSPIETTNLAVTRPKDQTKWLEADVPDALRGIFSVKIIPYFDHDTPINHFVADFKDSGASPRIQLIYQQSGNNWRLVTPGGNIDVGAVTFSRMQEITLTIDPNVSSLTVQGCTTGDGTTTGTPYVITEGDINWGMTNAGASQFNGLISEPFNLSNP